MWSKYANYVKYEIFIHFRYLFFSDIIQICIYSLVYSLTYLSLFFYNRRQIFRCTTVLIPSCMVCILFTNIWREKILKSKLNLHDIKSRIKRCRAVVRRPKNITRQMFPICRQDKILFRKSSNTVFSKV